jgi:hypothetical protein
LKRGKPGLPPLLAMTFIGSQSKHSFFPDLQAEMIFV